MGLFRGVELDDLVLTGDRVSLRPWTPADAAAVVRALADPAMHTFVSLPRPYTLRDAQDFVTVIGNAGRRDGTGLGAAVVENATGRLLGSADLRLGEAPDIGYWIAPDAQGAGYAADASRLLAEWAFRMGIGRLEIHCDVTNVASARTALAAGFRLDGVRRGAIGAVEGRHDMAVFGRLPTDAGGPGVPTLPPLPRDGLSDGVVRLRTVQPGDAPALIEMETDPVTVANGFTGRVPSATDVHRMAARAALDWLTTGPAVFAVVDETSGDVAGSLRIRLAGPPQIGGVGYVIHPRFRGRGLAGRALRLAAAWAFEQAGFARLELGAKTANVASQQAAITAGFEPDGLWAARLRNPDGSFSDEVRFALINPAARRA